MILNKEEIELSLLEKVNEKIEILRHEIAQSMFESLTKETYFVFDKKQEDIVGGPFSTKSAAQAYIKEMGSKDLVVMTEKNLEKKLGIKPNANESHGTSYEKDLDPNKKIVVKGVKGMKSKPFTKKFKNMAAYEKWLDSDESGDYEIHYVMNESDEELEV